MNNNTVIVYVNDFSNGNVTVDAARLREYFNKCLLKMVIVRKSNFAQLNRRKCSTWQIMKTQFGKP